MDTPRANTEPCHPALAAYVEGRSSLAGALLQRLRAGDAPMRRRALRVLADILWCDSWADAQGVPHALFASPYRFRSSVIGPPRERPAGVERLGTHCRLQTTTNWALDLRTFQDATDYFEHLSRSMKKKLKRYVNGTERWGLKLEPIQTPGDMDRFLRVFSKQFPQSNWEGTDRRSLYEAYALFEELGCARGFLMVDAQGVDAVATLGYYTGRAFNLHLLARQDSALDFLSPGYCATFALIQRVLEEKRADFFFFGPGQYEYKERFLGEALPVYRYERHVWMNLPGLLRLHTRARRRRAAGRTL